MAQDILDGVNPTRMELLNLKDRTKLAIKGHGLLKEKRDALIKEFFDILDRVKGIRENAERSLREANEALVEAQIAMGDLAVRKASLAVKESIDVDITSRSIMGVTVPITDVKVEERTIIDRGYGFTDTTIQLDEAAKKFEESVKFLIELGEVEKTIFLLAEEIESTKRRVNALEHIMIPRFENTDAILIPCFIGNLVTEHCLSWFFIVVGGLAMVFSFLNVPVMTKTRRAEKCFWCFYGSLIYMLCVCRIVLGGDWLIMSLLGVSFGLLSVFLPIILCSWHFDWAILHHKGLICLAVDTVLAYLMVFFGCLMLTVSLKSDSREWSSLTIFDSFKTHRSL